jgi:hypothetical protein
MSRKRSMMATQWKKQPESVADKVLKRAEISKVSLPILFPHYYLAL